MSKKNTKTKKFSPYRKYGFDRTMANNWNYESYRYWCICDEGRDKPPSQRETNFFFKYGMKNKKTGRSIWSYIPEDYKKLIIEWVRMTKSEHKEVRTYSPNAGRKITNWLHQAEIMYWYELNNI